MSLDEALQAISGLAALIPIPAIQGLASVLPVIIRDVEHSGLFDLTEEIDLSQLGSHSRAAFVELAKRLHAGV